jgi:hypothetical protein
MSGTKEWIKTYCQADYVTDERAAQLLDYIVLNGGILLNLRGSVYLVYGGCVVDLEDIEHLQLVLQYGGYLGRERTLPESIHRSLVSQARQDAMDLLTWLVEQGDRSTIQRLENIELNPDELCKILKRVSTRYRCELHKYCEDRLSKRMVDMDFRTGETFGQARRQAQEILNALIEDGAQFYSYSIHDLIYLRGSMRNFRGNANILAMLKWTLGIEIESYKRDTLAFLRQLVRPLLQEIPYDTVLIVDGEPRPTPTMPYRLHERFLNWLSVLVGSGTVQYQGIRDQSESNNDEEKEIQ